MVGGSGSSSTAVILFFYFLLICTNLLLRGLERGVKKKKGRLCRCWNLPRRLVWLVLAGCVDVVLPGQRDRTFLRAMQFRLYNSVTLNAPLLQLHVLG